MQQFSALFPSQHKSSFIKHPFNIPVWTILRLFKCFPPNGYKREGPDLNTIPKEYRQIPNTTIRFETMEVLFTSLAFFIFFNDYINTRG